MKTMKFEALKAKAKRILGDGIALEVFLSPRAGGFFNDETFGAFARMARAEYIFAERPELVKFAQAYEQLHPELALPTTGDSVAAVAAEVARRDPSATRGAGDEFALLALKAREEGCKLIDRWDVRSVASLIDLFPETIPKMYLKAGLTAECDEDGEWVITFDPQGQRQHQPHDQSEGTYPRQRA